MLQNPAPILHTLTICHGSQEQVVVPGGLMAHVVNDPMTQRDPVTLNDPSDPVKFNDPT